MLPVTGENGIKSRKPLNTACTGGSVFTSSASRLSPYRLPLDPLQMYHISHLYIVCANWGFFLTYPAASNQHMQHFHRGKNMISKWIYGKNVFWFIKGLLKSNLFANRNQLYHDLTVAWGVGKGVKSCISTLSIDKSVWKKHVLR